MTQAQKPHIEPEFVMPSHETLRAWCVRARSGEGSPYVHISPDELEGLLEQLEVLQEVVQRVAEGRPGELPWWIVKVARAALAQNGSNPASSLHPAEADGLEPSETVSTPATCPECEGRGVKGGHGDLRDCPACKGTGEPSPASSPKEDE